MKNKYLISALSLIVGLGLGTLTNKGLLQSRAEEVTAPLPVFMSANGSNHEYFNAIVGGGGPTGTNRIMRYSFSITNSQWSSLQVYSKLYLSIPYNPDYNHLGYMSLALTNNTYDGSYVYDTSKISRLSVGLNYFYGMTTFDLPQFMTNNFLKQSTITNNGGLYQGGNIFFIITLPVNSFDPQYMQNMLNGVNLYENLPASESEQNAYTKGYNNGYSDGFNDGTIDGYDNGYNVGFDAGVASDFDSFSWLTAIFSGFTAFFSIQFLPGVTIGGVAILVMTLTLLPFLIGLFKGGKD